MERLGPDVVVYRVIPIKEAFFPEGATNLPPDAFALSTEDKDYAAEHNAPPALSVWDSNRTTKEQAAAFRKDNPGGFRVYSLPVSVIELHAKDLPRPVTVVRDPLTGPEGEKPGADGHCGVLGTERRSGDPKPGYKRFRRELADYCSSNGFTLIVLKAS